MAAIREQVSTASEHIDAQRLGAVVHDELAAILGPEKATLMLATEIRLLAQLLDQEDIFIDPMLRYGGPFTAFVFRGRAHLSQVPVYACIHKSHVIAAAGPNRYSNGVSDIIYDASGWSVIERSTGAHLTYVHSYVLAWLQCVTKHRSGPLQGRPILWSASSTPKSYRTPEP